MAECSSYPMDFFFWLSLALQTLQIVAGDIYEIYTTNQLWEHKNDSKPLAYPSSSRAVCEHLGDRYLAQGYLGGALKVSWHLSLVLTTLKFYPHWGLNWEPSAMRKAIYFALHRKPCNHAYTQSNKMVYLVKTTIPVKVSNQFWSRHGNMPAHLVSAVCDWLEVSSLLLIKGNPFISTVSLVASHI